MAVAALSTQSTRTNTCPHGLPLGACPICNGMGGGGGAKKADFSAKAGEMSWNQCAAIGAFLKAQQNAKLAKEQDFQNFLQGLSAFQNAMTNASAKLTALTQLFSNNMPAIIAKPVNLVINTLISVLNFAKNLPTTLAEFTKALNQKLADISDKLTAMMGELKAAIAKKVSEFVKDVKKKLKSIFSVFAPFGSDADDNDEKFIDEAKKAFELKTFIHELYNKITETEQKMTEHNEEKLEQGTL